MYLVFDDLIDFNIWHTKVNKHFGYPNKETKTEQYTEAITNETNNKVICNFDEKAPSELLEGIKQITKDEALTQGLIKLEI